MKVHFLSIVVLIMCLFPLGAEEFLYKHQAGDQYRILSTVHQDVFVNNRLSHTAEILNRIAVEVTAESNGTGTHRAIFQTSERAGNTVGRSFQWAREYESIFDRDPLGRMKIDKKYFMPVVRDVPVFPNRSIEVGERWTYEGHEMHDFRDNYGIVEPYRIPFTANYRYVGNREWKGKTFPAFSVSYRIDSRPPSVRGVVWPRRIQGASEQMVYWDMVMGQAVAYSEDFRYTFSLSDGRTIEYRGKAEAEIVEAARMDRERMAEEIAEDIDRLAIADVTVRVADEGIVISMDDIRFAPDTAIMLAGEREKLDKVVEILSRYQERDILVGGHTALAGTAEGRQRLSAERAAVVADYLIARGARSPDRVVVRGYGADRPLADNDTEEGRRRNRRVEIIILEN